MRWTFIPGDPAAEPAADGTDTAYCDRIVIDGMEGEDLGMSYLSDIAVWYAERNVRAGYDIRTTGHCFKGPYAIMWDRIEIAFEDDVAVGALRGHLASAWGPEGQQLGEVGEPRTERIE